MCEGVRYWFGGRQITTRFADPLPMLPVLTRHHGVGLLPWGRQQRDISHLPMGGWAPLPMLKAGRWDQFFPQSVKLPVCAFLARDFETHLHWFKVTKGQCLQGAVAHYEKERRVYVVMVAPEAFGSMYGVWPQIMVDSSLKL